LSARGLAIQNLPDRKDFLISWQLTPKIFSFREIFVPIQVKDASDIAAVVRAARKAQGIRQDDAAGAIGVSENFMVRVENGAEGIQWGKLFQVLAGLGIRVWADLPESATALVAAERDNLKKRQARSRQRQAPAAAVRNPADQDEHG